MKATQQMLLDWEAGKPEVMELWRKMNSRCMQALMRSQKNSSDFDKIHYESNTYLLGKGPGTGLAKAFSSGNRMAVCDRSYRSILIG